MLLLRRSTGTALSRMRKAAWPKCLFRLCVDAVGHIPHSQRMERPNPSQSDGLGRRALITSAASIALASEARADGTIVAVGYLRWTERRPTISLLEKPAADDGLAGARL